MKRKHLLLTLLMALAVPLAVNAQQSIVVDGLQYTITTTNGNKARLDGLATGSSLTTLNIPETVEYEGTIYPVQEIVANAFNGNTQLTGSLVIPNSVTTINAAAFRNCTGFNGMLVLGSSLTTVAPRVFQGCTNLACIMVKATTPPSLQSTSLGDISTDIIVEVPEGSLSAYQGASVWQDYTNLFEMESVPYPSNNLEIFAPHINPGDIDVLELWSGLVTPSGKGTIQMFNEPVNPNFPNGLRNGWMRLNCTGTPTSGNSIRITVAMPYFDHPVNLLKVNLLIKPSTTETSGSGMVTIYKCGLLQLGYVIGDDLSNNTFHSLQTYYPSNYSSTEYTSVEKLITGIPANARLAFRTVSSSSQQAGSYWDVDCNSVTGGLVNSIVPTNFQLAAHDASSATYSWDALTGIVYEFQCKTYDKAINQWSNWTTVSNNLTQGTCTIPIENRYRYYTRARGISYDNQNVVYYTDFCDEVGFFPGEAMVTEFPYTERFPIHDLDPIETNNLLLLTPQWYYHNDGNPVELSSTYGYERNDVYCYLPRLLLDNLVFFVQDEGSTVFNPQPEYAISPMMQGIKDLQLSFSAFGYKGDSYGAATGYPLTFEVGLMTDPLDPSTFVTVKTVTIDGYTSTEIDEIYFYDVTPVDAHIAFRVQPDAELKSVLMIDKVEVSVAPDCKPTHNLTVGTVTGNAVSLSWDAYNNDTWEIAYQQKTGAGDNQPWESVVVNTNPYTLTGLNHNSSYTIKVRSYCDENEQGEWSNAVTAITECADTYQEVTYYDDFESYTVGDGPNCWYSFIDPNHPTLYSEPTVVVHQGVKALEICPPAMEGDMSASFTRVYLPKMQNLKNLKIRLRAKKDNDLTYTNSALWIRVAAIYDGTPEAVSVLGCGATYSELLLNGAEWREYEIFLMNDQSYENGYIELYTNNVADMGDVGHTSMVNKIYIDWIEVSVDVEYNKTFIGTVNEMWDVAENWDPVGVPTSTDNVFLDYQQNVIIPSGCVADVNAIDYPSSATLTIKDGGQLKFNYGQRRRGTQAAHMHLKLVSPIIEKHFEGYTDPELRDHYVLMSFPKSEGLSLRMDAYLPLYSGLNNTTINGYVDCYFFNGTRLEREWVNCRYVDLDSHLNTAFVLEPGMGFLYSISESAPYSDKNIAWHNLRVPSSREVIYKELTYYGTRFGLWNLVGNPFMCDAYMYKHHDHGFVNPWTEYWKMNSTGDAIVLAESGAPVGPMEGVFVVSSYYITNLDFRTTPPENKANSVDFTVRAANTRSTDVADRARIRFGEGEDIDYCTIMPSHNRLYIPGDNKQITIMNVGTLGEIPLNFEASTDGRYTIGFKNDAIEDLAYCHLIDNLTGADIDLLETPEYTFEAKVRDYPSRFRIVFEANNDPSEDPDADETVVFAYFCNGNLVVSNDGAATLQVIDLMGRILSSEQINGCVETQINAAPGVYVLRLINGDKVKTQKIVVQ